MDTRYKFTGHVLSSSAIVGQTCYPFINIFMLSKLLLLLLLHYTKVIQTAHFDAFPIFKAGLYMTLLDSIIILFKYKGQYST